MGQNKKILLLAANGESSRWVYNALKKDFAFTKVIVETPVSKKYLFKRRIKKIGLVKTLGQALFSVLAVPVLRSKAKKRKAAIIEQYKLDNSPFDESTTAFVPSVNDESCFLLLKQIMPDIVVVNGTRIIQRKILAAFPDTIFINTHVGITPAYRGSHGGYWALYNKDAANFGTTIHLIDAGIDTGEVLQYVFIMPDKKDNFTTYPVLQVAAGIAGLKSVLQRVIDGNYIPQKNTAPGNMYYQPTLWQYLMNSTK